MPSFSSGPVAGRSSSRYIVRAAGEGSALSTFIDSIQFHPAIRLVDTIGPSAGPPHTAVIDTDPGTAEQLRLRHLNQLTIEPDQPLSLFDYGSSPV
jgi:hypothetical protein